MAIVASSLFVINLGIIFTCLLAIVVVALLGPMKEDATRMAPGLMNIFQQGVTSVVELLEQLLTSLKGNAKPMTQQAGFLDASPSDIRNEMGNIQSKSFLSASNDSNAENTFEPEQEQDSGSDSVEKIVDTNDSLITPVKSSLPTTSSTSEDQTDNEQSPEQPVEPPSSQEIKALATETTQKPPLSPTKSNKITMSMLDVSVSLQLQSAVSRKSKYGTAMHPVEFRKFRVTKVGKITNDSVRIRFALPENKRLEIPLGRHVVVQATINGQVIRRSYTPVTRPDLPGCFDLVVKGYEYGKMSSYLQKLSPIDEVEIRGPIGNFNYRMNTYKHICMLAGGTGLTPCLQTITSVLEMPEYQQDNTFFTLLYQSRTEGDILLLHELRSLHQKFNTRLTIAFFVSSPTHSTWGDRIGQVRGPINEDFIRKLQCMTPQPDMYCVAGPAGFNATMENTLRDIDDSKAVFVF
jgi:cytochrome-b5 reductase